MKNETFYVEGMQIIFCNEEGGKNSHGDQDSIRALGSIAI